MGVLLFTVPQGELRKTWPYISVGIEPATTSRSTSIFCLVAYVKAVFMLKNWV
jgi:hypothetical protein